MYLLRLVVQQLIVQPLGGFAPLDDLVAQNYQTALPLWAFTVANRCAL